MSVSSSSAAAPADARSLGGYFVVVHGRRLGPLAGAELQGVGVREDSWAWQSGMSDWQRAGQVEELQQLLFDVPPPLPTAVPVDAAVSSPAPSAVDFRRAMPFVAGIVLCYLLTAPLIWLLSLIGLGGGIIERTVSEIPIRVCCAGASFFLARSVRLPFAWAWALPPMLNPLIGLIEAIGLAVFARRRMRAAGLPTNFFGPRK